VDKLEKYQPQEITPNIDYLEADSAPKDSSILHLFQPVLRRWYWVLVIFILVSAVGAPIIWHVKRPIYTTSGTIHIRPLVADLLTGAHESGGISNYDIYVNTQAQIIRDNRVLQNVADVLDDNNTLLGTGIDRISALKTALADGTITIKHLTRTEFLGVSMTSRKPRQAEQIVNAFMKEYMKVVDNIDLGMEDQDLANLRKLKLELENKLKNHLQELRKINEKYGADSLEGLQRVALGDITSLREQLRNLELVISDTLTQIELLSDPNHPIDIPPDMLKNRSDSINNDPYVRETTAILVQLQMELSSYKQRLTLKNPEIERITKSIETFEKDLEIYRAKAGEKFDEAMVRFMEQKREADLTKAKVQLANYQAMESEYSRRLVEELEQNKDMGNVQFEIRTRQAEMARDQSEYNLVLERIDDIEIKRQRPARITISDEASTGPPVTKREKLLAALAIGALALGISFALLMGKIDKTIYDPEDIERCIGVPMIGTTSDLTHVEKKLLLEQVAEDYQTIRANLGLLSNGKIPHKMVVTSSGVREGKSTFAVNLATSLAQAGKRVLLIDGDLRKPDIERLLNLPHDSWGLMDVLYGLKKFEETVRSVPLSGLDVLTADGRNPAEAVELLEKPQTAECINNISQRYDHVIIDTPPVLAVPDARLWARMADAVVLSSLAGQTESSDLKETLDLLSQINVKILGNVLCNVSPSSSHYRYRYGYGYGYGRRRGDGNNDKRKRPKPKTLLISGPGSK